MNEDNLIKYYNKFNEDKRLTRRHGIVEYSVSMKYILSYLKEFDSPKILDVGAGCGRYSIDLCNMGYDVSAVELVKHNLMTLKSKSDKVKSYLGNATNLNMFSSNSFDVVLLFGPMYHLISNDDKIKALSEAKRVLKDNGYIFISYYMNEYGIVKYGFMEKNIISSLNNELIDNDFHIVPKDDDLYSMVRLEDINYLKDSCNLKREKIISQDGPTDYIRKYVNDLSDDEFDLYLKYIYSICERRELLGASSHVLDILKK